MHTAADADELSRGRVDEDDGAVAQDVDPPRALPDGNRKQLLSRPVRALSGAFAHRSLSSSARARTWTTRHLLRQQCTSSAGLANGSTHLSFSDGRTRRPGAGSTQAVGEHATRLHVSALRRRWRWGHWDPRCPGVDLECPGAATGRPTPSLLGPGAIASHPPPFPSPGSLPQFDVSAPPEIASLSEPSSLSPR